MDINYPFLFKNDDIEKIEWCISRNTKYIENILSNENIYNCRVLPGVDEITYEILKINNLHTPWNLHDIYSSIITSSLIVRMNIFLSYLLKIGINPTSARLIAIFSEKKARTKLEKSRLLRDGWKYSFCIINNYY